MLTTSKKAASILMKSCSEYIWQMPQFSFFQVVLKKLKVKYQITPVVLFYDSHSYCNGWIIESSNVKKIFKRSWSVKLFGFYVTIISNQQLWYRYVQRYTNADLKRNIIDSLFLHYQSLYFEWRFDVCSILQ